MSIIVAIALLVLSAAVVLLFAMLGELASRLEGSPESVDRIHPVTAVISGTRPSHWIAPFDIDPPDFLVTFSTSCGTCTAMARQSEQLLTTLNSDHGPGRGGLVVSCPYREVGEEFVAKYGLVGDGSRVAIDEDGKWLLSEFGLDLSPSIILFDSGAVRTAYGFTSIAALNRILENGGP